MEGKEQRFFSWGNSSEKLRLKFIERLLCAGPLASISGASTGLTLPMTLFHDPPFTEGEAEAHRN